MPTFKTCECPLYVKASEYLFHAAKESVYVRLSRSIIQKINEFPNVNIEELAFDANTTASSVVKYSKLLGYRTFTELKNDILPYSITNNANDLIYDEIQIIKDIYNYIPYEACSDLAKVLYKKNNILILTNEFSFSVANFFREQVSYKDRNIFVVDRSNAPLIKRFAKTIDCLFILTLTGKWLENNKLITELPSNIQVVLVSNRIPPGVEKLNPLFLSLHGYPNFLSSNYHSHKYMESVIFNIIKEIKEL
ncbi:transcriptional regulator, RpiR family protein [Pectobacterium aroidearum]|uniref:transcriptional regulator, RpiR family protein n=1 Tax=Pectobacterium aroidearum TaxID=1201031 RepID=UPI0031593A9B